MRTLGIVLGAIFLAGLVIGGIAWGVVSKNRAYADGQDFANAHPAEWEVVSFDPDDRTHVVTMHIACTSLRSYTIILNPGEGVRMRQALNMAPQMPLLHAHWPSMTRNGYSAYAELMQRLQFKKK